MASFVPVRLAYKVYEPAGGVDINLHPVIFMHGATTCKEYWADIPQIIADRTRRRAYSLDSRNHGDSEWSDVFDFDVNGDDLLNFMDLKSIPKAVLIGHSMGGIATVKAALKQPGRFEMVFIEDMYVKRVPQHVLDTVSGLIYLCDEAVANIPCDCEEEAANKFVLDFVNNEISSNTIHTLFIRLLEERKFRSNVKWQTFQQLGPKKSETRSSRQFPFKRDVKGKYSLKTNTKALLEAMKTEELAMSEPCGLYEGPAFFIYGTESPFKVNDEEENIQKYFPNAQLIGIEGASHSVHTDLPEEFIEAVLKHLLNGQTKQRTLANKI